MTKPQSATEIIIEKERKRIFDKIRLMKPPKKGENIGDIAEQLGYINALTEVLKIIYP